jgi:hypothetical protein
MNVLVGKRITFVVAAEILGGAERNAIVLTVCFARVEGAEEARAAIGKANAELVRARQGSEATSGAYARLVADALACRLRNAPEPSAATAVSLER